MKKKNGLIKLQSPLKSINQQFIKKLVIQSVKQKLKIILIFHSLERMDPYITTRKKKNGIFRNGFSFEKDNNISFHEKDRIVLPNPLKKGDTWEVDSKTFLILKRYPYYDYRATTNFTIKYEIISKNESLNTPLGKLKNCLYLKGTGQTKFIGDSEIGAIEINIVSEEWYARGIGLVKSVRTEETNSDLFGTTQMVQVLESFN